MKYTILIVTILFLLAGCDRTFDELNEAGTTRFVQGNYETAIDYYNQSIEAEPEQFSAYFNKARALSELEKFDEALENFKIAEKKNPDNPAIYFEKGKMFLKSTRYDAAIIEFTYAFQIYPKESKYLFYRGLAYSQLNQMGSACEDWQKADTMGNPDAKGYLKQFCGNQ